MRVQKAADMFGVAHRVGCYPRAESLHNLLSSVRASAENRNAMHILGSRELCHFKRVLAGIQQC